MPRADLQPENTSGDVSAESAESSRPGLRITNPADLSGMALRAEQILSHVSADEWEEIIRDWVGSAEPSYHKLSKPGSTGDRGVDVAAFCDEEGYSGVWEAYQGKNYQEGLVFSDVFPEMVKLVDALVEGDTFKKPPIKYAFVSRKGVKTSLQHLLDDPGGIKTPFINELKKHINKAKQNAKDGEEAKNIYQISKKKYTLKQLQDVKTYAEKILDFSIFRFYDATDILGGKGQEWYFVSKYQTKLERAVGPLRLKDTKQGLYLEKLVDVFKEQDKSCKDVASVEIHPEYCVEFQENRDSFYSAEVLRKSVEDSVPPNTYDHLKEQIYMGVIPTARGTYKSGLKRLRKVHKKAYQMHLTGLDLIIPIMNPLDRLGICHQLANEDKLTWVK